MESFVELSLEKDIAVVKINKPSALNALSSEIIHQLNNTLNLIENDQSIKVIIITGEGKSFVAGADISEMVKMDVVRAKEYANKGACLFERIENIKKVTIAAINGFALGGGCELAMACDIRIASDKAKFGQPEVGLGIIPGFSGIRKMFDLLGEAKAKEFVFTGKMIDASEAEKVGLVNRVVSPESLMDECIKISSEIVSKSFNAILVSKQVINNLKGAAIEKISYQSERFADCFSHPDQKNGMTAFLNKQKPTFE